MEIARRLVDEAKEGGADAIKFQSYKRRRSLRSIRRHTGTLQGATTSQYELFKRHDSFWKKEFEQLASYCGSVGIEFMSTPSTSNRRIFSTICAASSDLFLGHHEQAFHRTFAAFAKPIILSTGASDEAEVREAVGWINRYNVPLALLHCVLNYPTKDIDANLGMIKGLKKAFPGYVVGYSDHTQPDDEMKVVSSAVLIGAEIIEKHFTHDKSLPGNDHYHAMDRRDLSRSVRVSRTCAR
jgi:N-acetylneuraminate synthase